MDGKIYVWLCNYSKRLVKKEKAFNNIKGYCSVFHAASCDTGDR
jgi:hypothetical protein